MVSRGTVFRGKASWRKRKDGIRSEGVGAVKKILAGVNECTHSHKARLEPEQGAVSAEWGRNMSGGTLDPVNWSL